MPGTTVPRGSAALVAAVEGHGSAGEGCGDSTPALGDVDDTGELRAVDGIVATLLDTALPGGTLEHAPHATAIARTRVDRASGRITTSQHAPQ
jgi:hypothetical protein